MYPSCSRYVILAQTRFRGMADTLQGAIDLARKIQAEGRVDGSLAVWQRGDLLAVVDRSCFVWLMPGTLPQVECVTMLPPAEELIDDRD